MESQQIKINETQKANRNYELLNLDDLTLQELIGQGSFGKVYKVKSKKSGEIYAAKISMEIIDDNSIDFITNLSREVKINSRLNHPSVLKFIGYSPINFKKKQSQLLLLNLLPMDHWKI